MSECVACVPITRVAGGEIARAVLSGSNEALMKTREASKTMAAATPSTATVPSHNHMAARPVTPIAGDTDFDDDVLSLILVAWASEMTAPPAQAQALARLAPMSSQLCSAANAAALHLLSSHLHAAQVAAGGLKAAYAEWVAERRSRGVATPPVELELDMADAVAAAGSPLRALWCSVPELPLSWTVLNHSVTDDVNATAAISSAGLSCITGNGSVRLTWQHSGADHDESRYVKRLPFVDGDRPFASFELACQLGLGLHPGLMSRCRAESRAASLCPCCGKWRRHGHKEHAEWVPDLLDKAMLPLPPVRGADTGERRPATTRNSSRDSEEFESEEFERLLAEMRLASDLKCMCASDGKCGRFIGRPPSTAAA